MRKRQALHRMIGSDEFSRAGARGVLASRTRPSSDWRRRNTAHDAQAFFTRLPGGSGEFGLRPILAMVAAIKSYGTHDRTTRVAIRTSWGAAEP
jgi:uncharacterized membrane protein YebE (DUF533 family)